MAFDLEAPKPIADIPVSPKKEPEVLKAMEAKAEQREAKHDLFAVAADIKWKTLTYAEMDFYAKKPPLYHPKNYYEYAPERPKTVEELLVEARRLIDEKGWCKSRFYEENPETGEKVSFCMLGALVEANGTNAHNTTQGKASRLLTAAILERVGFVQGFDPAHMIPNFNDSPITQKRDVLSVFDRAIDYARSC